jgi:hypothetical protein
LPTKPDDAIPITLDDSFADSALPRAGDTKKSFDGTDVERYHYLVDKIDLQTKTVTITPGKKVVLYVTGNIKTGSAGGLVHDCTGATDCQPTDLQIFGYKQPAEGEAAPEVCLDNGKKLEAFIFAPKYQLGIKANPNSLFKGAMWGKTWGKIPGCSDNNVAIVQGAKWEELMVPLKPGPLLELPQIGPVRAWCEEAIDTVAADSRCVPDTIRLSGSPSPSPSPVAP